MRSSRIRSRPQRSVAPSTTRQFYSCSFELAQPSAGRDADQPAQNDGAAQQGDDMARAQQGNLLPKPGDPRKRN